MKLHQIVVFSCTLLFYGWSNANPLIKAPPGIKDPTIIEELCKHKSFNVITDQTGDHFRSGCNVATGECLSLRGAINTVNFCRSTDTKTIHLLADATYDVVDIDTHSRPRGDNGSGYRGLPRISRDMVINGHGATINHASPPDDTSKFGLIHVLRNVHLTLLNTSLHGGGNHIEVGAGIYNDGRVTTRNVEFLEFTGGSGRGIALFNNGIATLRRTNFVDSDTWVGSIYNAPEATLDIRDAHIYKRPSTPQTHGIHSAFFNDGNAVLKNVHFSNLYVTEAIIDNRGPLIVDGCTFDSAVFSFEANSDAVVIQSSHSMSLLSSTFSGNEMPSIVNLLGSGSFVIRDVTIAGNGVADPLPVSIDPTILAALRVGGDVTLEISNSVIAANSNGLDCHVADTAEFLRTGNNLDSDGSCGFSATSVDPGLEPISDDNGGATPTMMPSASSVLVDSGSACRSRDQRGAIRPVRVSSRFTSGCDIGAVEFGSAVPVK